MRLLGKAVLLHTTSRSNDVRELQSAQSRGTGTGQFSHAKKEGGVGGELAVRSASREVGRWNDLRRIARHASTHEREGAWDGCIAASSS